MLIGEGSFLGPLLELIGRHADVWKFLGGGAFVAILSLIIQRRHYQFERLRESRKAYSEAKTGADYLELRVCSLSLADATALIQHVHISKHLAELYPELQRHLRRRYKGTPRYTGTPEEWADELYNKLAAVRDALEANTEQWDSLHPHERLSVLKAMLLARKNRLMQEKQPK